MNYLPFLWEGIWCLQHSSHSGGFWEKHPRLVKYRLMGAAWGKGIKVVTDYSAALSFQQAYKYAQIFKSLSQETKLPVSGQLSRVVEFMLPSTVGRKPRKQSIFDITRWFLTNMLWQWWVLAHGAATDPGGSNSDKENWEDSPDTYAKKGTLWETL